MTLNSKLLAASMWRRYSEIVYSALVDGSVEQFEIPVSCHEY